MAERLRLRDGLFEDGAVSLGAHLTECIFIGSHYCGYAALQLKLQRWPGSRHLSLLLGATTALWMCPVGPLGRHGYGLFRAAEVSWCSLVQRAQRVTRRHRWRLQ